jgi:hypothetical protein
MRSRRPDLEVLSGSFYEDHWTSPSVALRLLPAGQRRTIRLLIWNPFFNQRYLRNKVAVAFDGEIVFHDLIFGGASLKIERELKAREELLLEVQSEATMGADPLDPRDRGVRMKLTQVVAPSDG